jgi:beta-glucanase (GH16 family)
VSGAPVSGMNYTAGMATTLGKFSQLYGRFEAKIKLPAGAGLHPVFWTMPFDNATWPPEFDIMEAKGSELTTQYLSLHYGASIPAHQFDTTIVNNGVDYTADYHLYQLDWSASRIIWYIDGVEKKRMTTNIPSIAMYLLFSVQIGDSFAGSVSASFPNTMLD